MRALVQGEAHHELKVLNFAQIAPNSHHNPTTRKRDMRPRLEIKLVRFMALLT
jgi:hypothetical protein